MFIEEYKTIPFAKRYLVSNLGNVKSKKYDRILKGEFNNSGYKRVSLGNIKNRYFIHRLVALCFIPNPKNKEEVNHKDGNRKNNIVSNLEWVTKSENKKHSYLTGLYKPMKGDNHPNSKLTSVKVQEIKNLLKSGYTCVYIANKYFVHRKTISDIKCGKTWRD